MTAMNPDDLRRDWTARVMEAPGLEIPAVPTLRNSIMAATVLASTSALGVMGLLSFGRVRGITLQGIGSHPAPLAMAAGALALLA